jgi:hypothetical protein
MAAINPMQVKELNEILVRHRRWTKHLNGGRRADLSRRNFGSVALSGIDLASATIVGADIRRCTSAAPIYRTRICSPPI